MERCHVRAGGRGEEAEDQMLGHIRHQLGGTIALPLPPDTGKKITGRFPAGRLVQYKAGVLFIRFFGSHEEYDGIDAETV